MTNEIELAIAKFKFTRLSIFIFVFIVSFFIQGMYWKTFDMTDSGMWGPQAQYVLNNDTREFNFLGAYGHPGGPIIEGTVVVHQLLNVSYDNAVLVVVTFLNSIIIAGVCLLCFSLRKNNLWWISVLGILSFNRLYEYATPPTAVAATLAVLLCLLTLYIYENLGKLETIYLTLWGLVVGLIIATRFDIGVFSFLVFLPLIFLSVKWKKVILIIFQAFLTFVIFDPFMWFMPFKHIQDLIFKIVYHYYNFPQVIRMTPLAILLLSFLAFISIFISIGFLFLQKQKKITSPLSPIFINTLILMTIIFYIIFLNSRIQEERYLLPIIFIWEVFLPLFIFTLIEKRTTQIMFILLFYVYNLVFIIQSFCWLKNLK